MLISIGLAWKSQLSSEFLLTWLQAPVDLGASATMLDGQTEAWVMYKECAIMLDGSTIFKADQVCWMCAGRINPSVCQYNS